MELTDSLQIRKIIVGVDPLKAMAFVVGQKVGELQTVCNIELDDRYLFKYNKPRYLVYIKKESGDTFVWKSITDVPAIVEYDCNF